jgi:hypothetical protein
MSSPASIKGRLGWKRRALKAEEELIKKESIIKQLLFDNAMDRARIKLLEAQGRPR